jgi:hypothetical protein
MDAYIYRAALYCEDCAENVGMVCHTETHDGRTSTCDSECTPIGPHPNGGGEADTPQHCDTCDVFLENPLTGDGLGYVRERIEAEQAQNVRTGFDATTRVGDWRTFYADALAG